MDKKDNTLEKSDARRFGLYAQVGMFFSSKGQLNEAAFKKTISEGLQKLKANKPPERFVETASEWLSDYLNEILEYLVEKGIAEPSLRLFTIAIEESSRYGLSNISLSIDCMKRVFGSLPVTGKATPAKKGTPDEMREKIFEAAIDVFAEEGFHRATIDKMAAKAGIGKGSVYRHFKSKEEIRDELLKNTSFLVVEVISEITSRNIDILQMIKEMIESWIMFISENHKLYRIIQKEAMHSSTGETIMFYDFIITHLPLFKEKIVSLNRDKELKTTNLYTVFYGIMGFIDGVVQKWYRCGMNYPLIDEVPVILEVLFNGFVGEKTTRKTFFVPPEENQ